MEKATKNETKRERTPAQRAAFAKAKLKGGLTTMSPRQRHAQKIKDLLSALHSWGFSTSKILAKACGCAGTSFISGAAKAGLVRYELILGRQYVLLTRRGLDLLKSMTDPDDLVAVERANLGLVQTVSLHAFFHDGYAQKIFAEKMGAAICNELPYIWLSERHLRARYSDKKEDLSDGAKVPDGAFFCKGVLTYYEIERSKKSKVEISVMFKNLCNMIEDKANARIEIHLIGNIAASYQDIYKRWLGGSWTAYSMGTDGKLFKSGDYKVTEKMRGALERFSFITVDAATLKK